MTPEELKVIEDGLDEAEGIGAISFEARHTMERLIEEVRRLRKLVAIAKLNFAEMDRIDGLDQIEFAERNGLYDEYLSGTNWQEVFERYDEVAK